MAPGFGPTGGPSKREKGESPPDSLFWDSGLAKGPSSHLSPIESILRYANSMQLSGDTETALDLLEAQYDRVAEFAAQSKDNVPSALEVYRKGVELAAQLGREQEVSEWAIEFIELVKQDPQVVPSPGLAGAYAVLIRSLWLQAEFDRVDDWCRDGAAVYAENFGEISTESIEYLFISAEVWRELSDYDRAYDCLTQAVSIAEHPSYSENGDFSPKGSGYDNLLLCLAGAACSNDRMPVARAAIKKVRERMAEFGTEPPGPMLEDLEVYLAFRDPDRDMIELTSARRERAIREHRASSPATIPARLDYVHALLGEGDVGEAWSELDQVLELLDAQSNITTEHYFDHTVARVYLLCKLCQQSTAEDSKGYLAEALQSISDLTAASREILAEEPETIEAIPDLIQHHLRLAELEGELYRSVDFEPAGKWAAENLESALQLLQIGNYSPNKSRLRLLENLSTWYFHNGELERAEELWAQAITVKTQLSEDELNEIEMEDREGNGDTADLF